jgi:hypothetical protein
VDFCDRHVADVMHCVKTGVSSVKPTRLNKLQGYIFVSLQYESFSVNSVLSACLCVCSYSLYFYLHF